MINDIHIKKNGLPLNLKYEKSYIHKFGDFFHPFLTN